MVRPLGCNGKYGGSGTLKHQRHGEPVCRKCKTSKNHYNREYKRKGIIFYKPQPCGTPAAAKRHRRAGEPVDFKCRLAESEYKRQRKLARENA